MPSRLLLQLVLVSTGAVAGPFAVPAEATIAPIMVQANFVGTGSVSCVGSTCAIEAESITCWISGVNGSRLPYANGCDASLAATVPAVPGGGVPACAGVGEGTFTIADPVSGHGVSLKATVAATPAAAVFATPAVFGMSGFTYVGYGSGSVKPCVSVGDRLAEFEGTFTYARLL